jgi:hypothetical protein
MIPNVKIFLFFFILFCSNISSAQVVLLDSENKSVIVFAHIVSENGKLLGTSDINGIINLRELKKSKSKVFTIQHISYENLEIKFDTLLDRKSIVLKSRTNSLPPFTKNSETPDYLVLKAFFRSYQTENGVPKYFMDGLIEYYIPKNKSKKVKRRVIEYRSFKNKKLLKKEKEKERSSMMILDIVGLPYLSRSIVVDDFNKKYSIQDSINIQLIKRKGVLAGVIKNDKKKKIIHLNINILVPKKERVAKVFGYTQRMVRHVISEDYYNQSGDRIFKDALISRNVSRNFLFKHKQEEKFKEVNGIMEIYVIGKEYMTKGKVKEVNFSIYKGKESSNYSTEYWKDIEIKSPKSIENLLGKELKLSN